VPADIYEEIVRLRNAGKRGALATIIQVRGSIPAYETAKLLVREDGSMIGTIGGGCVEAEVWQAAREVMAEEKSRRLTFHLNNDAKYDSGLICGGTLEVYVEPILAQPTALIFGAGHVSQAIAKVASLTGFLISVVDDRESFANRERFPEASTIFADEYENVFPKVAVNSLTYIVIVTRGHKGDMRVLRWAVETPARYIGMIGSRRKVISTYRELEREGVPAASLERVHAPIGLEIGAITPEEIAVSVVAEMIAIRRGAASQSSEIRHMSVSGQT
jgi:xanthine dehydrogenase accessory factor